MNKTEQEKQTPLNDKNWSFTDKNLLMLLHYISSRMLYERVAHHYWMKIMSLMYATIISGHFTTLFLSLTDNFLGTSLPIAFPFWFNFPTVLDI